MSDEVVSGRRQPSWEVAVEGGDAPVGPPPSRFVQLEVTVLVEVVDEPALREAAGLALVRDLGGAPDPVLLTELPNCVGSAVRASDLVRDVPGLRIAGSSLGADYGEPPAP